MNEKILACKDCGEPALTRDGQPTRKGYCADCMGKRIHAGKTSSRHVQAATKALDDGLANAENSGLAVRLTPVIDATDGFTHEMMSIPMIGHPKYYKIIGRMADIHASKNADYGGGNPLGNFLEVQKMGMEPYRGVLARMTDKYARVMSLARPGYRAQVVDESIRDTLMDLANYAILALVLMDSAAQEAAHENAV